MICIYSTFEQLFIASLLLQPDHKASGNVTILHFKKAEKHCISNLYQPWKVYLQDLIFLFFIFISDCLLQNI